jgi:hypothetical protein
MKTNRFNRVTPVWISELQKNQVFVFGSNLAGIHGLGAAKQALQWGAKMGHGIGHHGETFAIPTKDKKIRVLPLVDIEIYVEGFLIYARQHPELDFLVTEIGCGHAAYRHALIAPFFKDAVTMTNVWLPQRFLDHIIFE